MLSNCHVKRSARNQQKMKLPMLDHPFNRLFDRLFGWPNVYNFCILCGVPPRSALFFISSVLPPPFPLMLLNLRNCLCRFSYTGFAMFQVYLKLVLPSTASRPHIHYPLLTLALATLLSRSPSPSPYWTSASFHQSPFAGQHVVRLRS